VTKHWTPQGIPYPDKNEKMVSIPSYFADADAAFRTLAARGAAGGIDFVIGSGTTDANANLSVTFARLSRCDGMIVQGRGVGSLLFHWQWQASAGVGLAKLVNPPDMTPRPGTYVNYLAIGWGVSK
jgi:hypothetical protein